jgi:hypothetical protein
MSVQREERMTTQVDLTDQELAELQDITNEPDPAAAVRTAMAEYLRYVRRLRLKALSGQVEMQENWTALERAEGAGGVHDPGPGAH